MVQYNLESDRPRREPQGPQVASVASEAAEATPKLLLYLAKKMMGGGSDPRQIYKNTGWYQDVDGQWLYSIGDQKMKVREDNPLLDVSKEKDRYGVKPSDAKQPGPDIRIYEKPGLPMKHEEGVDPVGPRDEKGVYQTHRTETQWPRIEKRYPDRPWDAQQPPMPPPLIRQKERMYPEQYNRDQLSLQDVVEPKGTTFGNYDLWDQWSHPGHDYSKVRPSETRGPNADELFEHPSLFEMTPEVMDVRMAGSHYTHGGPQDYRGSFIDMGPGLVEATGSLGGVKLPNSMESVALHEFGHKGQRVYDMPRGGNPDEGGMMRRGDDMMMDAGQRYRDLIRLENEEVAKLVNLGIAPDEAERMVADFYPNIERMKQKYSTVSSGSPNDPNIGTGQTEPKYLGYRGEAGEAQSKNLQTRAATLRNDLPMTKPGGYSRNEQFPSTSENAFEPLDDTRPHEGDIHPFDTYQIPPDLTRLRTDLPHGGRREVMPRLGEYDWLLKKPAAFGAGAATPFLMGADDASAAPADKGDRIGHPSKDDVMQERLALAKQNAQSADRRATGATGPAPERTDDVLTPWSATKSILSGARNAGEEFVGDLARAHPVSGSMIRAADYLRPNKRLMPNTEDVRAFTDRYAPQGVQDVTRFESRNPIEQAWKWLAEQGLF